jgi:hypothetical protein
MHHLTIVPEVQATEHRVERWLVNSDLERMWCYLSIYLETLTVVTRNSGKESRYLNPGSPEHKDGALPLDSAFSTACCISPCTLTIAHSITTYLTINQQNSNVQRHWITNLATPLDTILSQFHSYLTPTSSFPNFHLNGILIYYTVFQVVNFQGVYLSIYLSIHLPIYLWLYSFCRLWQPFQFLNLYVCGRTLWMGDQPVARPLPTLRKTQTE